MILSLFLTSLTFAQVISKARDYEARIQTDSAITQTHLEESVHKVTPTGSKPKLPPRPPRCPTGARTESARSTCIWCGRAVHPLRRHCLASNAPAIVVANMGTSKRFAGRPL